MSLVKLYSDERAPNPRRVRIFLAEKGETGVEIVNVDLASRQTETDSFRQINPLGWLPVLELDDGSRIAESVAICRYFEETQPSPPLFGEGAVGRAQVEQWNRHMELEILVPVSESFRHGHQYWADRLEQAPDYATITTKRIASRFDWLDTTLADREWIAGDSYSIADITALAGIDFARLLKLRVGDDRKHLARWYAAMKARPSSSA